jgi:Protein of unknown function (DUF4232)
MISNLTGAMFLCLVAASRLTSTLFASDSQNTSQAHWCGASELRITADWQGVNTTKIGGVTFSARAGSACALRGRPRITLYGDGRRMNVRERSGGVLTNPQDQIERTITVRPGESAGVAFDWVNWCGRQSHSPIVLAVGVPGGVGRLSTFVRYGHVPRSQAAPACLAPSQPSVILVAFIRLVTHATPLP